MAREAPAMTVGGMVGIPGPAASFRTGGLDGVL